jgi:hypothetical protein
MCLELGLAVLGLRLPPAPEEALLLWMCSIPCIDEGVLCIFPASGGALASSHVHRIQPQALLVVGA